MIPLHSILAIKDVLQSVIQKLPIIAAIACAAVLAIAFIIGFVKGFRRISWGCMAWLGSGLAFIVADKFLRSRNPLLSISAVAALDEEMQSFVSSFSIALGCTIVGLLFYGVLSLIFKNRRIRKRNPETCEYSGYEYEDDYDDYDDYDAPNRLVDARMKKPNIVGRVAGGMICMLNTATILAVIAAFGLLFISATSLVNGRLGRLFDIQLVAKFRDYASLYALDFVTIGIIIIVSCKGYKNGLIGSIRSLVVMFGVLIAAVISFWLPFSSFVNNEKIYFLKLLIDRCSDLLVRISPKIERIAGIGGKLLAGVCIFAVAALALWLFNFLLAKFCYSIRGSAPARIIDGVLACVLYFIIGVFIVVAMWTVLYVMDYCGIFKTTEIFNENAALAKGMFRFVEIYLKPLFNKLLAKV